MASHRPWIPCLFIALFLFLGGTLSWAQEARFGDLAEGPYDRLVIRGANVIKGHGGPPTGPYDIVVQSDTIAEMVPFDPVTAQRREDSDRPTGDRVIDASGMYVMPGMVDLHHHLRQEPLPLKYIYYLKLAHGATTVGPASDRGVSEAMEQARLSEENEILAPRMYPLWSWGDSTDFSQEEIEDPNMAPKVAQQMVDRGARQVYLNDITWNQELFGAAAEAVRKAGGVTGVHIPPSNTAVVDAVDAARLGVDMILHHYGYAESSLERTVQGFPDDYHFDDENDRFRQAGEVWQEADQSPVTRNRLLGEVADSLAAYGVAMQPTRVVYEANRDILRARSLPWHEKYTHQALLDLYQPSKEHHGAYFYDWSSEDEQAWYDAFDLWGDLIGAFSARGGTVAYGTDDAYIWATPGFSNIRELQLMRESGMRPLEVIQAATKNSAETLREPRLGLVHPGYKADLLIVDGNPAENFRYMYSFGALTVDEEGETYRTEGIVHTIKDGIVIENERLMDEVEGMVEESKEGVDEPNPVDAPFEP
jgi:hypothetical protein